MVYITRREQFSASHKLWNPDFTIQENMDCYGKCASVNFHGHNYVLFVTIKGEINPKTGYLIDIKILKEIISVYLIEKLDHKNLNIDVEFLENLNPTLENLLVKFWQILYEPIKAQSCVLHMIKLVETENNYGEYYG